ncbi:uncharacterized protein LOC127004096 isoform X2 [Eriocheir sinensis]|uniref:uncharacterized protein LOC127004096 isoform X2 n=1 Tax=Eriocheir sinensis TaxID=95602 RepID=UPI0021C846A8|nr:uncharacterized protein LOC127004096 isoform X2 [Eriocheir sinensis]
MERRTQGPATLPSSKGATLPGYRVGPVRYGVRLAPHDGPGAAVPARRCSDGDLGSSEKSHIVAERSQRLGSVPICKLPFVPNGAEGSGRQLGTGEGERGTSSPLHLKEAHSLLNNKWTPLTVPTSSSLLAPSWARPHPIRRSFNTSPRPWVTPTASETHPTPPQTFDNSCSDNNNDKKSAASGRVRVTATDGAGVHPAIGAKTPQLKLSPHPSAEGTPSSPQGAARPVPPLNLHDDAATFRSEATIVVTQTIADQEKKDNQKSRSPLYRRRGAGTLSLAQGSAAGGNTSGRDMNATAIGEGSTLLEEVRAGGLSPPTAKYTCCVAGRSPRHPLPRHSTMFSYPGPARPTIHEKPVSAHLTSDQNSARPHTTPTHAHGTAVQCAVISGEGGGSKTSGGSGHGDRVAPPAPVTTQTNAPTTITTTTTTTTATTTTTTTHSAAPARRPVRPRPEIPDHLYRRWAALLPADAVLEHCRSKAHSEVGAGAPGGIPAPSDEGLKPVTPVDFVRAVGGLQDVRQGLHLLTPGRLAQSRLGDPTGGLGGGRKDGGRGPPPARPPRSRQNHLEELRKCTERLKTPSPDKKVRADSAPPPETAATAESAVATAASGSETQDGAGMGQGKARRRSNEVRPVLHRHPALGKSPSLPPQLPSARDAENVGPSHSDADKNMKEETLQSIRREEEDFFLEEMTKLPPRPRPEARVDIPPRVIVVRSASVSQVDVASDGAFLPRSGKSPTTIRIYPLCKDYWGSNTLPKRKPAVVTKEGGITGGGLPHSHPPLTGAASISDMTIVGAKSALPQPEKLETKSKSESELSMAGRCEAKDALSELKESLLNNRVEVSGVHSATEKQEETAGRDSGHGVEGAGHSPPADGGDEGGGKHDHQAETCKTKDETASVLKSENRESGNKKGDRERDSKSNRVSFSDEVKDIGLEEGGVLLHLNHLPTGEGGARHPNVVFTLGDPDPGDEAPSPVGGCEHRGVDVLPKGSEGHSGQEREGRAGGIDPLPTVSRGLIGPAGALTTQDSVNCKYVLSESEGESPPGGAQPVSGGPTPLGYTSGPSPSQYPEHSSSHASIEAPAQPNRTPLSEVDSKRRNYFLLGKIKGGEGDEVLDHGAAGRQLECQVVQKDPRPSQCLVIKSGAREGEQYSTVGRIVRSRPRLPREDSDGDSGERDVSRAYMTQMSDDGAFGEDLKSGDQPDSSDSSSQDSVGPGQEGATSGSEALQDVPLRPALRRLISPMEGSDTRPQPFLPPMRSSQTAGIGFSAEEADESRGFVARESSMDQRGPFSMADTYMSEAAHSPESCHLLLFEPRVMDRAERKKKYHSDPSCERRASSEALLYLSDPHLGAARVLGPSDRSSGKGVVSQASTDSEGKDERGEQHPVSPPRVCTPQVLLSGHDSDGSDYPPCRTPARNASPTPYMQDSDSGERSAPRSPHVPRRYPNRPPRGPYGKMLEAEMNKSKGSSYLSEDTYLRVRDAKSCSPRPPSPGSPAVLVGQRPPLIIPTCRSYDDSSIPINYAASERPPRHKVNEELGTTSPVATSPVTSAWESDGEGTRSPPLPIVPVHQRTVSSPSKLFPPEGFTSEDEELVDYYTAARLLGQDRQQQQQRHQQDKRQQQQPQEKHEEQQQPLQQTKRHHHHQQQQNEQGDEQEQQQPQQQEQPQPQKQLQQQQQSSSSSSLAQDEKGVAGEGRHASSLLDHRHAEHRHSHKRHRDTRAHVVGELYETEKNYVRNLNFLLTSYQQTLKSPEYSAIIDSNLVDDIFFMVPEIHAIHERFLEELRQRQEARDASLCVGDLLLQMVNDPNVLDSYTAFTNNWKTAQEATKAASQAKPAFKHFLVARAREHQGKLDLKALLIKPVQRFPQYELLLKRMLKHTSREHPDHALLTETIGVVQQVASRINAVEQEALQHEQQQLFLKELENSIEGLVGLVQPDRTFIRHDLVTMQSRLVTRKERCLFLFSDLLVITAIKRRSATIRKGSSLPLTLLNPVESNKFKLSKFIPLDDLDIARSRDESMKKLAREIETLNDDLKTLNHIAKLSKSLKCPRGSMDEVIQDMIAQVQKQLSERQEPDSQPLELELTVTTQEVMENLTFMFSSAEKRAMWEEAFNDAKHKLAMSADRRPPPEFVSALPIRKTRAGLQFTCATATLGLNAHNLKDVWVCNSDGYVGQVCVLSLQPDPTVACCNGVCNARILSIASIPAAPQPDDDEDEEMPIDEDMRKRRSESLPPEMGCDNSDNHQPTMWLGTEDGFIHVYNCSDTIRIKKNKFKFQPGSPVHCIIHLDNRVFASLANGDIIIYRRDMSGEWNVAERQVVSISTAAAPVTKMMAVAGKLWCATLNTVRVLNTATLQVEHSFSVGGENGRGVSCMVSAGHGVWVSVHNSAAVRLYNTSTYDCLCEVNVAPAVTKMLASCDDIIRQHKAACLRVTALLACRDLLWVGTSAGVIITVPLAHNTHRIQAPLNMVGIPYGHTGHVRFLTSVELTPEPRPSRLKGHSRYSFKGKDHPHQTGTAAPPKLLVISGGDGYEDFRSSGMSELAGRDDSTNHLLLWQV